MSSRTASRARHKEVIDLADPVGDLAEAWLALSLPLPVAVPATAVRCQVAGCRSLPFVRLNTIDGDRNLCLCHFQFVKARARHKEASSRLAPAVNE